MSSGPWKRVSPDPWQADKETPAPNGPWGNEVSKGNAGKYLYDNGLCGLKDLSHSQCPPVLLYGYSRFGAKDPVEFLEGNVKNGTSGKGWERVGQQPNATPFQLYEAHSACPFIATHT